MEQLTREQAIEFHRSKKWQGWSDGAIVGFQLFQELLCVPFDVFHAATEKVLNRSVWTHEFALNHDGLIAEYLGQKPKPSFEDIMNLIPEEKRIVISV